MTKEAKNIVDFWNSVEKFTPCQIETDNSKKPFRVENIQREVLADHDIPWINKDRFKHFSADGKTWTYTIFLGIITLEDITTQMKELLHSDYPDYDLQNTKGVSCIASFKVNIQGLLVENSLSIPDYFLSMGALTLKEKYLDEWMNHRRVIERNMNDIFDNLCDELNSDDNKKAVQYCHIEHLLKSFIASAKWSDTNYQI
jgi:hypothetical protein